VSDTEDETDGQTDTERHRQTEMVN